MVVGSLKCPQVYTHLGHNPPAWSSQSCVCVSLGEHGTPGPLHALLAHVGTCEITLQVRSAQRYLSQSQIHPNPNPYFGVCINTYHSF